jgi:hypothetical protein
VTPLRKVLRSEISRCGVVRDGISLFEIFSLQRLGAGGHLPSYWAVSMQVPGMSAYLDKRLLAFLDGQQWTLEIYGRSSGKGSWSDYQFSIGCVIQNILIGLKNRHKSVDLESIFRPFHRVGKPAASVVGRIARSGFGYRKLPSGLFELVTTYRASKA